MYAYTFYVQGFLRKIWDRAYLWDVCYPRQLSPSSKDIDIYNSVFFMYVFSNILKILKFSIFNYKCFVRIWNLMNIKISVKLKDFSYIYIYIYIKSKCMLKCKMALIASTFSLSSWPNNMLANPFEIHLISSVSFVGFRVDGACFFVNSSQLGLRILDVA